MNSIQIQTAQNVFIEYQPASVGDRILAALIDTLIKIAYTFVIVMVFIYGIGAFSGKTQEPGTFLIALLIILILPMFFYTLALEIFMNGQTIGKRAMDIKVVMLDGTQPTVGAYLIRWLIRIIDVNVFYGIVAIITIASSKKGQRLGDMAANTTVITLKRRVMLDQTRLPETDSSYQPVYPQVSRLSDRDTEIIRETLQTYYRNGNDPYLLSSLANKLQTLLDATPGQSNLEFLETLIRDYTHITSKQ